MEYRYVNSFLRLLPLSQKFLNETLGSIQVVTWVVDLVDSISYQFDMLWCYVAYTQLAI